MSEPVSRQYMRMNKIILAFFVLISASGLAYPQKASDKTSVPQPEQKTDKSRASGTEAKRESQDILQQKRFAQDLLAVVDERAKALDISILKVKVTATVADALWERNETRARQLFVLAFQTIEVIKLDPKQDQRVAVAEKRGGTFGPLFHLRSIVLQLIAHRDYKLADDLRKAFERETENSDQKENKTSASLSKEEKTLIYLDVAIALAKTQPTQSAQLFRSLLRNGMNPTLAFSLVRMRRENALLANQLFSEALISARLHQFLADELASLAVYVLPSEEELFFGTNPLNDAARLSVTRQFLDYVYDGSKQLVAGNNLLTAGGNEIDTELSERAYYTLKDSLPLFQRLQPERTAFVEGQMRALLGFMSPQDANRAEATNHETVEDLVRKAESTIGERRRTIAFMRASAAALSEGNIERAVEIGNRIDDLYERKIQTSFVLYQAAMKQLREGKLERAYNYAKGIEFLPQRTAVFHRIAQRLWRDKEPDRARATMEEIWDWLGKVENTPQKVDAMLKLTATMAQHDTELGFELLQSTVRALNRTDFSFKQIEPNRLSVELQITTDMLDVDACFTTLAGKDFERSRTIAGSLTNPELALLAQAIVCQQVLAAR
jgi:hypothetical protein